MKKILLGFIAIGLFTFIGCKHTIIDLDGNTYKTVKIGTQKWMSQNLRTTKYSEGTPIPNVSDYTQWSNLTTGAWSHYDNDSSQYERSYGKLYNWYAVNTNKLCPTGWHVPTDAEWTLLTDYLAANGYDFEEAKVLKASSGWNHNIGQSGNGTDDSGWKGLPGGFRDYDGHFFSIGSTGSCWSSSEYDALHAWDRYLDYANGSLYRSCPNKRGGFSVRCLRD